MSERPPLRKRLRTNTGLAKRRIGDQKFTIDGLPRTEAEEQRLNEAFGRVFRTPEGKAVLDYLQQITVNRVMPEHELSERALLYREGARYLYGVINNRYQEGS